MAVSTLTSKGQITIPKEIREQFRLRMGQRVEFHVTPKGELMLRPGNRDVRLLKGIIRSSNRRTVTVEEMNQAIAAGAARTKIKTR